MVRRVVLAVLFIAATASVGVTAPTPAAAQRGPSFKLSPSAIEVGETTVGVGGGFQAGLVVFYVNSVGGTRLGSVQQRGSFEHKLDVSRLRAGDYRIWACLNLTEADGCQESAAAPLSVRAPTTTTSTTERETTTSERETTTSSSTTLLSTTTERETTSVTTGTTSSSTAVISSTTEGDLAISTTEQTVSTIDESIGISTDDTPDPTLDPNPDGLAISTTTAGPAYIPPNSTDPEDLLITAIEVSQGIQDLSSRMPLVADRTTWVRLHVDNGGDGAWTDVDGLLLLQRSGLPDLPLVPSNGPIITKKPRTDIDSTLNFEIPDEYLEEGALTIWAGVWSVLPSLVEEEPDPTNNIMSTTVEFHEADVPIIWLVALDDGGGPGPVVSDLLPLLDFAQVVHQDLLDYHPTANVNYHVYPAPVQPGPEAFEPGIWDLGLDQDLDDDDTPDEETAGARRHEPNIRMSWLLQDLPESENVLGWVDSSIPTGGYSGWAGYGVAWNKPSAGTPAHELGHSRGLKHVACKDADGDGVPDELKGGGIDPAHPTALPECSLAPISETGYFGLTTEQSTLTVYSNDPTDAAAAYPFMSYKNPGWTDPYHWCLLLQAVDVPCNPASIGVPPINLAPAADCTPEPIEGPGGTGIGMDLCFVNELPPTNPFGGDADEDTGVPWAAPVQYGFQQTCSADMQGKSFGEITFMVRKDSGEAHLDYACPDGAGTDGTTEQFFTVDIGQGPIAYSVDPNSWIVVSGYINTETGEMEIQQTARRDSIPVGLQQRFNASIMGAASGASPTDMFLSIERPLPDGGSEFFARVPIERSDSGHGDGSVHQGSTIGFMQAIPAPAACVSCYIKIKGIKGESPKVALNPQAPEVLSLDVFDTGDATRVEWTAAAPDGAELPLFDVLWGTPTGGWIHVVSSTSETAVEVPHDARYPGGDNVVVKVVAHGGGNTGEAESAPFRAPTHEPLLFTTGIPESGSSEQHDTVLLQAHLVDPELDTPDPESVRWASNLDGELGTGPLLRTRDLSVGVHVIQVQASDGDGNVAVDQFELEITERVNPTRYLEAPTEGAVELLAAGSSGLLSGAAESEGGPLASAADGLPGGFVGLAGLVVAVGAIGAGGGWFFSRRRPRQTL